MFCEFSPAGANRGGSGRHLPAHLTAGNAVQVRTACCQGKRPQPGPRGTDSLRGSRRPPDRPQSRRRGDWVCPAPHAPPHTSPERNQRGRCRGRLSPQATDNATGGLGPQAGPARPGGAGGSDPTSSPGPAPRGSPLSSAWASPWGWRASCFHQGSCQEKPRTRPSGTARGGRRGPGAGAPPSSCCFLSLTRL